MAAPETIVTSAELCLAYGADTVKQLLPLGGKGASAATFDPDRVLLALRGATGLVFGKVEIALQLGSIDLWWDAPSTTERDKAKLKELALRASNYFMRHYGQKAEEIPEEVLSAYEDVKRDIDEVAKHFATIGANTQPAVSTQNIFVYGPGAGHDPHGSPRRQWWNF